MKPTKMVIQIADLSTKLPRGTVEDVLIRMSEFIYCVDFVVIETKKVANALINYRNDLMRLSFDNMMLELNIFNMQRQHSGFDDIEFSTVNWIEDSPFNDDFDNMCC